MAENVISSICMSTKALCFVQEQDTLYLLLSAGSTQEDRNTS